jgi:hypothetical protein
MPDDPVSRRTWRATHRQDIQPPSRRRADHEHPFARSKADSPTLAAIWTRRGPVTHATPVHAGSTVDSLRSRESGSVWDARIVPHPCQNERQTAATSGHPRTPRMASDLDMRRLTPCLKQPSKQRVNRRRACPRDAPGQPSTTSSHHHQHTTSPRSIWALTCVVRSGARS